MEPPIGGWGSLPKQDSVSCSGKTKCFFMGKNRENPVNQLIYTGNNSHFKRLALGTLFIVKGSEFLVG
jgi:hypothetical protein